MFDIPFLTDLDSRAAVKGTRDALGLQPLWTRIGRHVVGNLTMASSSLRDFTITILGHYFAEQLSDSRETGSELETFLKWEQLAAYSRAHVNGDYGFRGTDRVRRLLAESSKVTISADRAHQILGNQKIYGLWGLYTMPSRASGLLDGDPFRLTPPARDVVERVYLPALAAHGVGKDAKRILAVLRQSESRVDVEGRDRPMITAVARVLSKKLLAPERAFYLRFLVYGGDRDETSGRQGQCATLIDETITAPDFAWSPPAVGHLVKRAVRQGKDWEPLAYRLARIRCAETVFAPVSILFAYLLGMDGNSLDEVAKRLRQEWGHGVSSVDQSGFEELRTELAGSAPETGERWVQIGHALASGDYVRLVELLAAQNNLVMNDRGGLPWIELANKKLVVRFRDEQGILPDKSKIPNLWRFPYFLDALRQVSRSCGGTDRVLQ